MESTPRNAVACASCQRQYRWDSRYAGQRIKCRCGETFEMPIVPPAEDEAVPVVIMPVGRGGEPSQTASQKTQDEKEIPTLEEIGTEEYEKLPVLTEATPASSRTASVVEQITHDGTIELNEKSQPQAPSVPKIPVLKQGPSLTPVLPVSFNNFGSPVLPQLAMSESEIVEPKTDEAAAKEITKMLYVPAAMLLGGMVVSTAFWRYLLPESWGATLTGAGSALGVQLLVLLPWSIYSAVLAARWMELEFGPIVPVVARFGAITLGPAALGDAMLFGLMQHEFEWEFLLVGFFFYVVLVGLPVWIWFRTNLHETMLIVLLQAAPRLFLIFFLASTMPHLFGLK